MSLPVFQADTEITITVAFTQNPGGAPIDPSDVQLILQDPTRTTSTVLMSSLTRTGAGVWTYAFTPGRSGKWRAQGQGSGNADVTTPIYEFWVNGSELLGA